MADEQQEQQHETVTTTTERNLHKLLNIGELIFEIDLRSDGPPVIVVTVSCCCCPAIVIVHVQLQINHNNMTQ